MTKILEILYTHQDSKYADFTSKLIPNIPREKFIGVRSPEYKKILKEIEQNAQDELPCFLETLPHQFHEENILHVIYLNSLKNFDDAISKIEKFLPYADNWAVTDSLNIPCFKKTPKKLVPYLQKWLENEKPYTKRVAMIFLKKYFLEENFKTQYLDWVSKIRSQEYYVNMMIAWYFAEALTKQWDSTISYIKEQKLDKWTHNKAIQKARESFRICDENKELLKQLKIK